MFDVAAAAAAALSLTAMLTRSGHTYQMEYFRHPFSFMMYMSI